MTDAARVRVLPLDVQFEVLPGESIMAAAQRQGLWWPTVCGGVAECGICWVVIDEGASHCSPMELAERTTLARGRQAHEVRARLACQVRLKGDVTLTRSAVKVGRKET